MPLPKLPLIPFPRNCAAKEGRFEWRGPASIELANGRRQLENVPGATLAIDAKEIGHAEGYRLSIGETGIAIIGNDDAGLFYGIQALRQLLRLRDSAGNLPQLEIFDWPDFPVRGYTLDISRCKVPSMPELRALIDRLAEWKFNQFQLYTEHAFAYRDHAIVWREASPMTAAEIRELDARCRERCIELVPNQNSLGHMERWLKHPDYRRLAENEEKLLTLAPDIESQEFMEGLYRELLPNFSSRQFNIGCDEPWDLGTGRSRGECERRGTGRVYLDYLAGLCRRAQALGFAPMFWGDIIVKHPEFIPEVPAGVTALLWGYEAHQPLDEEAEAFARAGIPFLLCPGTSAWHSLIGRRESWEPNIIRATLLARAFGAQGMLLTEWGDNGHWQHAPVVLAPMAWGANHLWCAAAIETPEDLIEPLSLHALGDATGNAARGLLILANAQSVARRVRIHNNSPLSLILQKPQLPLPENLTENDLENIQSRIAEGLRLIRAAEMRCDDAALMMEEIENGAAFALHACRLARARIRHHDAIGEIPMEIKKELGIELELLIKDFQRLWLARNRPGGLSESVTKFDPLRALYRAP